MNGHKYMLFKNKLNDVHIKGKGENILLNYSKIVYFDTISVERLKSMISY